MVFCRGVSLTDAQHAELSGLLPNNIKFYIVYVVMGLEKFNRTLLLGLRFLMI